MIMVPNDNVQNDDVCQIKVYSAPVFLARCNLAITNVSMGECRNLSVLNIDRNI